MNSIFQNIEQIKAYIESDGKIKFKIKVSANAKNNSIEFCDDFIKVRIKERAIEGRANKAIIEFFSEIFKYPKSKISILNGDKSSIKTIQIIS